MATDTLTVIIPGTPVAQGRPKAGRWRSKDGREGVSMRDPGRSRSWKGDAQVHMLKARGGRPVAEGPLRVELLAVFPCPKGDYRKCEPRERRWKVSKNNDVDNIAKASMDAGNAVLWHDDGQVVELVARKIIAAQGEAPRVELRISPMTDDPPGGE